MPRPRSGVAFGPPPSTAASNGGTPAAPPPARGRAGRRTGSGGGFLSGLGPAGYLWLLVGLEVAAIAGLRHYFRDHHGG